MIRAVVGLLIVSGMVYYSPVRDGSAALLETDGGALGLRGLIEESQMDAALAGVLLARGLRDAPSTQSVRVIPLTPSRSAGR